MTLIDLQTKRDEILMSVGVARETFGDRSVEYSDAKKALDLIDSEISRVTNTDSGSGRFRTSFVSFCK
jgi:hypothetical protein